MTTLHIVLASVLLVTIMAGLVRVIAGPTLADRMLAAQLFGTAGVTVLLLLGHGLRVTAFYDVALVFALLAGVTSVAFVRRTWHPPIEPLEPKEPGHES